MHKEKRHLSTISPPSRGASIHHLLHLDLARRGRVDDALLGSEALGLGLVVHALLERLVLGGVLGRGLGGGDARLVRAVLVVRAEHVVPPAEGRAVVVHERHVVEVVVVRAGPERDDVLQRPREVCGARQHGAAMKGGARAHRSRSARRWPGRGGA
jgi:hypothetical protein